MNNPQRALSTIAPTHGLHEVRATLYTSNGSEITYKYLLQEGGQLSLILPDHFQHPNPILIGVFRLGELVSEGVCVQSPGPYPIAEFANIVTWEVMKGIDIILAFGGIKGLELAALIMKDYRDGTEHTFTDQMRFLSASIYVKGCIWTPIKPMKKCIEEVKEQMEQSQAPPPEIEK